MNLKFTQSLLILLTYLSPLNVKAQQQRPDIKKEPTEMNVDMPDETVETDIVDLEQWQVESALLYNRFKDKPNAVVGQVMVRYGLNKRLELRALAEDGHQRDRYMEETVQSNAPLAIGLKLVVLKDHGMLPDITLVSSLKLPFTSRSSDQKIYWSPLYLLAFQNKFGEKWKLEYNGGIQQELYSNQWVWLVNASLHYKVTRPLELFMEYYAQYQVKALPQHNLGGGLAYQIGELAEVYVSGGSTIDYGDYNYFFSGGIAFRSH